MARRQHDRQAPAGTRRQRHSPGPRAATRANPAHLTTRELEVLHLLQQGLQNAEIARKLHLSTKTAGHHVSSILSKLGVRSRTEAVREATRLALLQHGDPDRPN
ncbi:response regulator transcription factor [Deinococcus malanensis]|uniref:response regulator transcription factor n=1 Tax=Deinococcus malanensis TaxID=1706855 RepID=UPI0036305BD3